MYECIKRNENQDWIAQRGDNYEKRILLQEARLNDQCGFKLPEMNLQGVTP